MVLGCFAVLDDSTRKGSHPGIQLFDIGGCEVWSTSPPLEKLANQKRSAASRDQFGVVGEIAILRQLSVRPVFEKSQAGGILLRCAHLRE